MIRVAEMEDAWQRMHGSEPHLRWRAGSRRRKMSLSQSLHAILTPGPGRSPESGVPSVCPHALMRRGDGYGYMERVGRWAATASSLGAWTPLPRADGRRGASLACALERVLACTRATREVGSWQGAK